MHALAVWVLYFAPWGDERPPRPVHEYTTQRACEDVLDAIIRNGFAEENELKCIAKGDPVPTQNPNAPRH